MNAKRPPAILLISADQSALSGMTATLEQAFTVHAASNSDDAFQILYDEWIHVVICDEDLEGQSGTDVLQVALDRWPETMRVLLTDGADLERLQSSISASSLYQFLVKPLIADKLMMTTRNAAELFQIQRDHDRLSLELKQISGPLTKRLKVQREAVKRGFGFDRIVRSENSPLNAVCKTAAQIASFDVPALILGETGTGKELLARAMHYASLRSERPFIAINCGALPDELLESELFGHKKGAFTGAHANRIGLLEQADGGTVFLDEIGDTSPAFQVKLLRFLQEGEIRPVGSNNTITVDVRIIAATNHDLEEQTRSGGFREDLYYRLAMSPLRMPALRDRRGDIPVLAGFLTDKAVRMHGKSISGIEQTALDFLVNFDWPGNVRQLENEVTRLLMLAVGDKLSAADLSPHILTAAPRNEEFDPIATATLAMEGSLKDRVEKMEARVLRETLTRLRWNKSRAAEELGLSRVGLRAKLERYGVEPPGLAQYDDEEGSEEHSNAPLEAAE